jgi:hypothetical protein
MSIKKRTAPKSPASHPAKVSSKTPAGAEGPAAFAGLQPEPAPFLLLFGPMGVALSLGATLALEALRPAARAFAARLAKKVAPNAESERKAAQELEERISSSTNIQRSTLEGVRRLLDSIAPEVASPLADLTAEYVTEDKPPDAFFRSAARLLGDLTAAEFSTLQELLARSCIDLVIQDRPEVSFMYRARGDDREGLRHFQYVRQLPEDDVRHPGQKKSVWADLGVLEPSHDPHALRVIQLLKLNGLADDPRKGGFLGVSGAESMVFFSGTLRRLGELLARKGE